MPPSEYIRVEHNVNGKIVSDPIEFSNLQYTGDGHTSVSKDAAANDDSRSSRKRKSRRRHKQNQQTKKTSDTKDTKALHDAIDRDHRRMGFEPMKRNHDQN